MPGLVCDRRNKKRDMTVGHGIPMRTGTVVPTCLPALTENQVAKDPVPTTSHHDWWIRAQSESLFKAAKVKQQAKV